MGLKIDRAKCVPSRPPPAALEDAPRSFLRSFPRLRRVRAPGLTGNRPSKTRRYWLSVGAQPSDTVARLFGQAGIIPAPPRKGVGAKKVPWTRGFAASAASR